MAAARNKPGHKLKGWAAKASPLLWLTVIIPTAVAVLYFGLIASDQYTSESSFVVRSSKNQTALSDIGAILQGAGFSRAQDDTYTVREYMQSRSALQELERGLPVRDFYEVKGDIFSRFNGFGLFDSREAFYQYYIKKIGINFDSISGITTLGVTSFDAGESAQINNALLKQGEALINKLNTRARQDTIRYAQEAVKVAEERVQKAAGNMTAYRTEHGIFDLKAQSEVQMGLVSKLQDELIVIQTQLDQVRAVTPDNPQIPGLKAREQSLRKEIALQMRMISGGGSNSLTNQAADYQRLYLENELAEKQLAVAVTSLENARAEAERQQLYLEVVSQPSVPDMPQLPQRIYNIIATLIIGLIVYGILSLLIASVREHKN
ncbi:capsule biosynthesis protein [Uruburuella testudinis]|uniref:Capsule biosynthesis protein n=1 Tax=Uruburuella testudinis TaxID=1282863 RepID=A0ABY4DW68_9NEIS|nr:capsule biosynthesis protein [Uruburuella testudinis]